MDINAIMARQNITQYRLSRETGIAYATINDICNERVRIEKCNGETLYRLSVALGVTIEDLIKDRVTIRESRSSFDVFKSNICHRVKDIGDLEFIIESLENNTVRMLYNRKWYAESLYVLAMIDYLCRENGIPTCDDYADIRRHKLAEPLYPMGIRIANDIMPDANYAEISMSNAIPEFVRFNIIESEVRNVY